MTSKAAGKSRLEELHNKLAEQLLKAVNDGCDAATLNQARQFLKDNDVKCAPTGNTPTDALAAAVAQRGVDLPFEGAPPATH